MKPTCDRLLPPWQPVSAVLGMWASFSIPSYIRPGGRHVSDLVCQKPPRGQGAIGHTITRQTHKKSIKRCWLRAELSSRRDAASGAALWSRSSHTRRPASAFYTFSSTLVCFHFQTPYKCAQVCTCEEIKKDRLAGIRAREECGSCEPNCGAEKKKHEKACWLPTNFFLCVCFVVIIISCISKRFSCII